MMIKVFFPILSNQKEMLQLLIELCWQNRWINEWGNCEVKGTATAWRKTPRNCGDISHIELSVIYLWEFLEAVLGEIKEEGKEQL